MELQLQEEIVFEASPRAVWKVVSDFAALDRWTVGLKVICATGHGIGAVRTVRSGDHELRERLESLDDSTMHLVYCLLSGPLPAANYVSTLSVHAAGTGRSRVCWSASCTPAGVEPGKLERGLRKAYRRHLVSLASLLATPEGTSITEGSR
ncbi:hypothetical protein C7T35_23020 [Variovorax sp. WS11]|uniref:SRPBCC family protein n=1 Tax=Variovorax sp. WS11 TaxID=1105204 RepID=UPI000D0CF23A|nr:SRPBCC family protein [Variovorax sp. WS11]NDZ17576.1 SRPBCC family protein [Variovorax sp. WS11]PSL82219.1 hypothetical protein C7T35_23020 [Variovorax sp. WS11]